MTLGAAVDVCRLGHLNFAENCRENARWGRGGAVEERDGVLLFATGSWLPVMSNGVVRIADSADPALVLEMAKAFFGERNRGYTVFVRDVASDNDLRAACESARFTTFGEPSPEMVCRLRLEDPRLPEGVELRVVGTAAEVADFAAINRDAYATYGMPPDVLGDTFSLPERVLDSPHVHSIVAYDSGRPVAAAQTIVSHRIAGAYWVGTIPEARGSGLGEAVTRAVTNAGFDMGALVSALQASPMGESIYKRLGYETLYSYLNYVRFARGSSHTPSASPIGA